MEKARIFDRVGDLVGATPVIEITNFRNEYALGGRIIAKLECFNPSGSVKDRVARAMLEDAFQKGLIKKGSVIVEPTSGNTGIGLASIGASMGVKIVLTMPETMSIERRNLLMAYGAEIVLTEGKKGMNGAIERAKELLTEIPESYMPSQFTNKVNPLVHEMTTGPEIWESTNGKIDFFVAGVGTGGTITGTGRFLKAQNPDIKIIAVEPKESSVLSGGKAGPHKIQGIGAGFVPDIFDFSICDEIIKVSAEDAFENGRQLARKEGILVGISSGAALQAAKEIAGRSENKEKTIVVLLPDTGERYLSTGMFE